MTIKEFIIQRIRLFFFLTAMILLAQFAVGSVLAPDQAIHYRDLISPFTMAGLCILPTVVTFSRKKLSVKQVLIRHAIQLVLIEGVMMLIVLMSKGIDSDRPAVMLLLAGVTLVIYVLAVGFMWLGQLSESKKMTAQLHQLQQNAEENN